MPDYIIHLICCASGVLLSSVCFFVGAFVMFLGGKNNNENNKTFLGKAKKGKVFTIPTKGVPEFPTEPSKEEKHILGKTTDFLKNLGGKT